MPNSPTPRRIGRVNRPKPKRIDNRTAAQSLVTPPVISTPSTTLDFFDMAVSITEPTGYFEPMPLTMGASAQANDLRIFVISCSGAAGENSTTLIPMVPSTPNGFTAAYSLNPGYETQGVFYRRLLSGDSDTTVYWTKPPKWRHFMWSTFTVRGASPTAAPVAGRARANYLQGNTGVTIEPVTVPSAGTMVFVVGNVADPSGGWPSWPNAMGVPDGWSHLVATDKSGIDYYPYDTSPALLAFGKSFSTAGTTGTVTIPIWPSSPAFEALYFFIQPAADVSVVVGAA